MSAGRPGRRRTSRALACLVLAAICTASVTGGGLLPAASSAARSLADVLQGRSPGERDDHGLVMTKPARAPDQRALAALRSGAGALPAPDGPAAFPRPAQAEAPAPGPESLARLPDALPPFGFAMTPPGGMLAPTPPPFSGIGGGGMGGGGGGGTIVPPPDGTLPAPEPPPAVPEPATWLAMLLGIFMVGAALRLRSRRRARRCEAARP